MGNPPFLGSKFLRPSLGDEYVDALFQLWSKRVHRESDICCYWFEKSRSAIQKKRAARSGLLATQGIRGGFNRETIQRILKSGGIFFAESDRDWVLDGASVHISMIGFDGGKEPVRILDGVRVDKIHAHLGTAADIGTAQRLAANIGKYVRAPEKGGKFDLEDDLARKMLKDVNPNAKPNSDILRPWVNADCLVQTRQNLWIVDFPADMDEANASQYEAPFHYLAENVKPFRAGNSDEKLRRLWWLYRRPGEGLRDAQVSHERILVTPMVSKYRLFMWLPTVIQPDKTTIPFTQSDDYFLGVLQSRLHEVWGLKLGTRLETRPRYTPTTCFETFPFPNPTAAQREAIAAAAQELDRLRTNWLNPPEWTRVETLEFPGSADGPWARYVHDADSRGIGTVRYPRVVPKDEVCAKELKKRTLTNLYNDRPAWLDLAHQKLDAAVFTAYGWPVDLTDDDLLARLLELNLTQSADQR